jgi:hypothetical protein
VVAGASAGAAEALVVVAGGRIVSTLALFALLTLNPIYWVAALVLALVDLPDFSTPMKSIARSLEKLPMRARNPTEASVERHAALSDVRRRSRGEQKSLVLGRRFDSRSAISPLLLQFLLPRIGGETAPSHHGRIAGPQSLSVRCEFFSLKALRRAIGKVVMALRPLEAQSSTTVALRRDGACVNPWVVIALLPKPRSSSRS